jgi:hypothetical protein
VTMNSVENWDEAWRQKAARGRQQEGPSCTPRRSDRGEPHLARAEVVVEDLLPVEVDRSLTVALEADAPVKGKRCNGLVRKERPRAGDASKGKEKRETHFSISEPMLKWLVYDE